MLSPSRISVVALVGALTLAAAGPGAAGRDPGPRAHASLDKNPCLKRATARKLRCPDLQMSPPSNMFVTRTRSGRVRLHAGNSINSVGKGPAELFGRRSSRWMMRAKQVIHRKDGTMLKLNTDARLGFKAIPGQYRYWKFKYAAEFELWRLDKRGRRIRLARRGPKVSYCLRDLFHRGPQLPGSPASFHYPACSQNFKQRSVTLGTSVGWSDVYPSTYHEQYMNVTGLKGCFAYVHLADPRNGIYESDEDNNEGETIVRLPFRGAGRFGCPRHSRGVEPPPDSGPDGGTEAPGY